MGIERGERGEEREEGFFFTQAKHAVGTVVSLRLASSFVLDDVLVDEGALGFEVSALSWSICSADSGGGIGGGNIEHCKFEFVVAVVVEGFAVGTEPASESIVRSLCCTMSSTLYE